jgi:hypothetical protein
LLPCRGPLPEHRGKIEDPDPLLAAELGHQPRPPVGVSPGKIGKELGDKVSVRPLACRKNRL